MPPGLSPAEKAIVKSFGDWAAFMHCYDLKPWEAGDIDEALAIFEAMARIPEAEE